jgi:hypothetical protein
MIIFDLACTNGHRFEGWFASTDDYASQAERQLVRCPVCDDAGVAKMHTAKAAPAVTPAAPVARAPDSMPIPAEVIQQLRAIVQRADDVGLRFAEEARKIHYEEAPPRAIRGQASSDEADALREEGIDFASLPSFLVDESH